MTTAPTTTITLAVPTPFHVDPARLVAWLGERGYSEIEGDSLYCCFIRGVQTVDVPKPGRAYYYLRDAVCAAAHNDGLEPHALAAQLAPPVEGPALQWAHMAAPAREAVLALLDGPAAEHRAAATLARMADDAESALAHEGAALGLEAAAAVLRSPAAPPPDLSALRGELLRSGQVEALDALDRLSGAGRRGSEG